MFRKQLHKLVLLFLMLAGFSAQAQVTYCVPSGTGSTFSITSVTTTGGTTNINNTSTYSTGGYGDFTATQTVGTAQGASFVLASTFGNNGGAGYGIWIDYNQDGDFADADEEVYVTQNNYVTSISATIVVPTTALAGTTRMRIVANYYSQNPTGQYCSTSISGEFEDYAVTVAVGTNCTGTPTAGTAVASAANVCSNASLSLSATGLTSNSNIGIGYQWQSSPTGTNTFTNITGATTNPYTITNQTAATDYRIVTTCSLSASSDTSSTVSVGQKSANTCYCITGLGGGSTPVITNATINGTTFNNSTTTAPANYYTSFPDTGSNTATLNQGVLYTMTNTYNSGAIASLWIDYNQDGVFDATEWTQLTTSATSNSTNFIVPGNALTGTTSMRIRSRSSGNTNDASSACSSFGSGETKDFIITIAVGTPCAGATSGGTVSPALSQVCPGTDVTLTATGYTTGTTGLIYQWESAATATGTFTAITGANSPTYVTPAYIADSTFYRLTVTCTNSNLSASSNIAQVAGPTAPATQASSVTANSSTGSSATINWVNGNGNYQVVFISDAATFTAPVSPGSPGSSNTTYSGSGQQLVYEGGYSNSILVDGLTGGSTYYARVYEVQYCYSSGDYYYDTTSGAGNTVVFTTPLPPVNDECSGAIAITTSNGFSTTPTTGSYTGATASANPPSGSNCFAGTDEDVWYKALIPASGNLVVEMNAIGGNSQSDNDYVLEAYTGSCGSLTYVICDDDGSLPSVGINGYMPRVDITGQTAGDTVYLRVRRYSSATRDTFLISAYDTSAAVRPAVATGGACTAANTITIDAASKNMFKWVPIFDGSGNIAAEIYANGNSLGAVTTSVNVNTTGTVRTSASGSAYADRNFTITPATQPTSNVEVRLYMKAAEVAALESAIPSLSNAYDITILKNGNTCGDYVPAPATSYFSNVENYGTDTTFAISIPSFSSFYLSGGVAPLPVNLTAISARAIGKANRIDWTSASEEAAAAFVVERSTNGVEFAAIGKVAAQGKSAAYTFTDEAPAAGISYYRLQMLDVNGESNYSRTVTATQGRSNTVAMSAYPNPATDRITVEVAGATEGSTITLKDLSGKTLAQQTLVGNSAVFSVASLPAGLYFAVYTGGNATQVIKITKQ